MIGLTRLAGRLQQDWWQPRLTGLTTLLWPLSLLYRCVAWANEQLWRSGWRQAQRLPVPVIVVGNLIVGGAGKTPTTIALLQWLQDEGWHPGVVSRGYGRASDALCLIMPDTTAVECGDEPLLIHQRTSAPVAVARNRVNAARALLARHPEVDVIVADDGLQHWQLARDLAIIVFDRRGAGNGLVLPAGPLRQPMPSQVPPHSWVLYNATQATTPLAGACAFSQLSGLVSLESWWRGEAPDPQALRALVQRSTSAPVLAAAGIGEPERFFAQLEQAGMRLKRLPLADHASLSPLPWSDAIAEVVVTEKDAIKLRLSDVPQTQQVWVAALDFQLPHALTDALRRALPTSNVCPP
jgi:tetraacyldisaccharide 4'-kinase